MVVRGSVSSLVSRGTRAAIPIRDFLYRHSAPGGRRASRADGQNRERSPSPCHGCGVRVSACARHSVCGWLFAHARWVMSSRTSLLSTVEDGKLAHEFIEPAVRREQVAQSHGQQRGGSDRPGEQNQMSKISPADHSLDDLIDCVHVLFLMVWAS